MLIPTSLRDTLQEIKSNLEKIETYQKIFSFFINELETKTVKKKYPFLLGYLKIILKTSYIISLYRLFDKDKESKTIKKLIYSIKNLQTTNLTIDKNLHKAFIAESDSYLKIVTSIEKKLGPVRHKIYAHNSGKWRIKTKVDLDNTTAWLHKAEDIFTEAVKLLGYSNYSEDMGITKEKIKKELDSLKNTVRVRGINH